MEDMSEILEGWYFRNAGTLAGPVHTQEIQRLLVTGVIQPGQLVWRRDRRGPDLFFSPAKAEAVLTVKNY